MTSPIPGDLDTDPELPLRIPLGHFVTGFAFLVLGLGAAILHLWSPGRAAALTHIHGLLVGWVVLTILGAMTQFVPVWSGRALHSTALARGQYLLVVLGLPVFLAGFAAGRPIVVPMGAALMVTGIGLFVYNIARTLPPVGRMDVTERHFGYALGFFAIAASLGFLLAVAHGLGLPRLGGITVTTVAVSHAVFAVFGAVMTTIVGAIYQLAKMFTQTELTRTSARARMAEELLYPFGVAAFGLSPFAETTSVAVAAYLMIAGGILSAGVVLLSHLRRSHVSPNAMLRRYVVVGGAMVLWPLAVVADTFLASSWRVDPFGGPGTAHVLLVGIVGVTVLGTVYHVIPFLVWVAQYSDDIGRRPVPMIDELYSSTVAKTDFVMLLAGVPTLVVGLALDRTAVAGTGGALVSVAAALTAANLLATVLRHRYGVGRAPPPTDDTEHVREN